MAETGGATDSAATEVASAPATDRTLEQKRALYALNTIRAHERKGKGYRDTYLTVVRGLPGMILQNGLGQALAFLLARAEGKRQGPEYQLYTELQTWLVGARDADHQERVYPAGDLLDALVSGTRQQFQQAQVRALDLMAWMRKFADAYLDVKTRGGSLPDATSQDDQPTSIQGG